MNQKSQKNKNIILRNIGLVLTVLIVNLCFYACNNSDSPIQINTNQNNKKSKKAIEITAEESFSNAGFTYYVCEESGKYVFERKKQNPDENFIEWDVYLLENVFNDGNRYIPEAYEKNLVNDGELDIKEGEYIYIQCSVNDFTDIEPNYNQSYIFYKK